MHESQDGTGVPSRSTCPRSNEVGPPRFDAMIFPHRCKYLMKLSIRSTLGVVAIAAAANSSAGAQRQVLTASLEYHAPVAGLPKPNFSPKGTQIPLTPIPASATLPPGSTRPAK